jgi:hypothetical protein
MNVEEEEVGVTGGSFEALLSVLRKGNFLQTLTEEWLWCGCHVNKKLDARDRRQDDEIKFFLLSLRLL